MHKSKKTTMMREKEISAILEVRKMTCPNRGQNVEALGAEGTGTQEAHPSARQGLPRAQRPPLGSEVVAWA